MESYFVLAASLGRDVDLSRAVALNVANSATPGFKRWVTRGSDEAAKAGTAPNVSGGRDLSAGSAVMTGAPLDLFLPDGVFMALESAQGELYSRGGRLSVDKTGRLLTDEGRVVHVQGSGGPLPGTVTVSPDGRLMDDGREMGRLALVRSNEASLVADGAYSLNNVSDVPRGTATVEVGAYESSNVQLTDEMVTMMRTLRHLESVQRVLKHEDALNERLFSALAKF